MHPDLERLIKLQALESELHSLKRTVDTETERRQAIQNAVDTRRAALEGIRARITQNQNGRREHEKELAAIQTRLSRYRDQLMAVKTNKEYHAMQSEIGVAEGEVQKFEDRILESMVQADEVGAELLAAEQELTRAESEAKVAGERVRAETTAAQQRLVTATAAREEVAKALPRAVLTTFETIASHRGAAVVEARDGHCSLCHVRLRPKVFQDVRRNELILQCDSCHRILYFVPPAPGQAAQSAAK